MRSKLIIMGAVGVMAAATLTVNAQNAVQHLGAKPVAATLLAPRSIDTDRQNVTIAVRAAESAEPTVSQSAKPEASEASKTEDESKPSMPHAAVSSDCLKAISDLKALHQNDVAEDATERMTSNDESAAAVTSDKSEDANEASAWVTALKAARAACLPQLPVRCESEISGLQAVFGAVRTAFSAIATACAARD